MRAIDIMTTGAISVAPDSSVEAIGKLFVDKRISAVPVIDADGRVLGIVSDTDLMQRIAGWPAPHDSWWLMLVESRTETAAKLKKTYGELARDVMTAPAVTVGPDTPVAEIAELLAKRHLRRVPVVADGKLVGIVSRTNLVQALSAGGGVAREPSARDGEIRAQVLAKIRETNPTNDHLINAIVSAGEVHLWHEVMTEEESEANRIIAESITGVKSVTSHASPLDMVASDIASVV